MLSDKTMVDSFTRFVKETEVRLKYALCAALGSDRGMEATADALAYGWEHWDRVQAMENPAGYLYRVGRNKARSRRKQHPLLPAVPSAEMPWVEPGLAEAMSRLSESQRTAVLLVHGFDWTPTEVAELLGVSAPTVRKHVERAMRKLRRKLGIEQ